MGVGGERALTSVVLVPKLLTAILNFPEMLGKCHGKKDLNFKITFCSIL